MFVKQGEFVFSVGIGKVFVEAGAVNIVMSHGFAVAVIASLAGAG